MSIVDNIVKFDRKPADQFIANPLNWRTHPQKQRTIIGKLLKELGWIGVAVENKNTGNLIDGHERVMQALENNELVPYIQVDLTEEQEKIALAAFDPSGELAEVDESILSILKEQICIEDEELLNFIKINIGPDSFDYTMLQNNFYRPELLEKELDQTCKDTKNSQYFYIEYYKDKDTYVKLKALLSPNMLSNNTLDPKFFNDLIIGRQNEI